MTAVFRFKWSARERAYVGRHDVHTYAVRPIVGGWELTVDGARHSTNRDHKPLLRMAQDLARGVDSEA
jgi:PP-loop superfamily ATP-utilizing enzyme